MMMNQQYQPEPKIKKSGPAAMFGGDSDEEDAYGYKPPVSKPPPSY
jgi:hypothetical protein